MRQRVKRNRLISLNLLLGQTLSDISQPKDWIERPNGFYALHDALRDVYYPPNPQRVWPSPTPKSKNKYVAAEFWRDEFPIFPLPEKHRQAFPFKDQIGGWVSEGRIRFPEEERIEIWETLGELKAAMAANDVPMAKNTPKIWADMPNLEFWIGKRVGFGVPAWTRYRSELKNASQPISSWITPVFEGSTLDSEADDFTQLVSNTNQTGTTEIQDIFKRKAFTYAKPVSLIREMLRQSMGPDDIVLDFFAGSATTAQAVMEVNAADLGSRRFVMVSSTEATAAEPDKNLCREVTAERIRRLNAASTGKYADLSGTFAYLRTREIDFDVLNTELAPAEAWTALEAMHGLPLTAYDTSRAWNEHAGDDVTLILADRTDEALIARLQALAAARANAFVYSWTPGQLKTALGPVDFEIRPVRETLVKRFQQ